MTINFIQPVNAGLTRFEDTEMGGGSRTKFADAKRFDSTGSLAETAASTVRMIDLEE